MVLDLFNSSVNPDEMCMVYCKTHANLYLECTNATLVRLITSTKHEHIAWYDPEVGKDPSGILSLTKAFLELSAYFAGDSEEIVKIKPIVADKDIFFVNGDLYFLHRKKDGEEVIRKITSYTRQELIEALEFYTGEDDKVPQAVYLTNCFLIKDNRLEYAFTAWGVAYDDVCNYLPVFNKDYHFIEEYGISAFEKKQVQVGEYFKAHGNFYKVLEDAEGQICLDQSKSVFTMYRGNKVGEAQPQKNSRIVPLNSFVKRIGG